MYGRLSAKCPEDGVERGTGGREGSNGIIIRSISLVGRQKIGEHLRKERQSGCKEKAEESTQRETTRA